MPEFCKLLCFISLILYIDINNNFIKSLNIIKINQSSSIIYSKQKYLLKLKILKDSSLDSNIFLKSFVFRLITINSGRRAETLNRRGTCRKQWIKLTCDSPLRAILQIRYRKESCGFYLSTIFSMIIRIKA